MPCRTGAPAPVVVFVGPSSVVVVVFVRGSRCVVVSAWSVLLCESFASVGGRRGGGRGKESVRTPSLVVTPVWPSAPRRWEAPPDKGSGRSMWRSWVVPAWLCVLSSCRGGGAVLSRAVLWSRVVLVGVGARGLAPQMSRPSCGCWAVWCGGCVVVVWRFAVIVRKRCLSRSKSSRGCRCRRVVAVVGSGWRVSCVIAGPVWLSACCSLPELMFCCRLPGVVRWSRASVLDVARWWPSPVVGNSLAVVVRCGCRQSCSSVFRGSVTVSFASPPESPMAVGLRAPRPPMCDRAPRSARTSVLAESDDCPIGCRPGSRCRRVSVSCDLLNESFLLFTATGGISC